eukprot:766395-Hanusia_phi.AAC.9
MRTGKFGLVLLTCVCLLCSTIAGEAGCEDKCCACSEAVIRGKDEEIGQLKAEIDKLRTMLEGCRGAESSVATSRGEEGGGDKCRREAEEVREQAETISILRDAIQELRAQAHAGTSAPPPGPDPLELSSGPGPAACQGCRRGGRYVQEVNGWNDDEEGQLEWVYGIPQGKRKVVIELGSNDGQWIYGFMT